MNDTDLIFTATTPPPLAVQMHQALATAYATRYGAFISADSMLRMLAEEATKVAEAHAQGGAGPR